ncbi:MAG: hypothetical protein WC766_04170 [Patescibacteria group bacterium]
MFNDLLRAKLLFSIRKNRSINLTSGGSFLVILVMRLAMMRRLDGERGSVCMSASIFSPFLIVNVRQLDDTSGSLLFEKSCLEERQDFWNTSSLGRFVLKNAPIGDVFQDSASFPDWG